jgi:uncharacterized membrane protein
MTLPLIAAVVVHEVATLILLGGLFFMLFVQLPAIARLRSPRQRLRVRRASFRRLFRWSWVGLSALWLTGLYELAARESTVPAAQLLATGGFYAAFTGLMLLAQFAVFGQIVVALEEGNAERASWLYRRLRTLLAAAFAIALLLLLLDVAGEALPAFFVPAG